MFFDLIAIHHHPNLPFFCLFFPHHFHTSHLTKLLRHTKLMIMISTMTTTNSLFTHILMHSVLRQFHSHMCLLQNWYQLPARNNSWHKRRKQTPEIFQKDHQLLPFELQLQWRTGVIQHSPKKTLTKDLTQEKELHSLSFLSPPFIRSDTIFTYFDSTENEWWTTKLCIYKKQKLCYK